MEDGGQFGSSVKLDKNPRRNAQAWPKLQLEVVKRIVRAAHREELGCTSYRKTSWEAEVAQISSCSKKKYAAERRGASANGPLGEEVVLQRKMFHSLVHPSTHPSILSFVHSIVHTESLIHGSLIQCFVDSLIHWFIGSMFHWLADSVIHWFVDSLIRCFIDPLVRWFVHSLIHCCTGSMIHWIIASLIHQFIDSLIRWFVGSLLHGFIISKIYWFIDSLLCCFMGSLTRCVIDSSTHFTTAHIHCFIGSLLHWFTDFLIHWLIGSIFWFSDSLLRSFIDTLIHRLIVSGSQIHRPIGSLIHGFFHVISLASQQPFVDALHNFSTSLFLHLKNFPIGHFLPIKALIFETPAPARAKHCLAVQGPMQGMVNWCSFSGVKQFF